MTRIEPEANLTQTDYEKMSKEDQEVEAIRKHFGEDELAFEQHTRFRRSHHDTVERRAKELEKFGYWGDDKYIYFVSKDDGQGFKAELTEELYQRILQSIKRASPARREAAKKASRSSFMHSPSVNWSSPSAIADAAQYAEIDVRAIIADLAKGWLREGDGSGSADDGIIYVLRHRKDHIVKIGKTKSLSATRAANYTVNHDDPDGWVVYHEVNTRNVSEVEARIHNSLQKYRAAYGYNAKEVFAVSVSIAMKAVYAEIEL